MTWKVSSEPSFDSNQRWNQLIWHECCRAQTNSFLDSFFFSRTVTLKSTFSGEPYKRKPARTHTEQDLFSSSCATFNPYTHLTLLQLLEDKMPVSVYFQQISTISLHPRLSIPPSLAFPALLLSLSPRLSFKLCSLTFRHALKGHPHEMELLGERHCKFQKATCNVS